MLPPTAQLCNLLEHHFVTFYSTSLCLSTAQLCDFLQHNFMTSHSSILWLFFIFYLFFLQHNFISSCSLSLYVFLQHSIVHSTSMIYHFLILTLFFHRNRALQLTKVVLCILLYSVRGMSLIAMMSPPFVDMTTFANTNTIADKCWT